ncbi:MAG: hypothetical protein K0Q79_2437 [Flavipsychrobacter sp.]|jgi:hypothetical protein|nr:hypothetical protein [Flavipsychrobacter sp.]
MNNLETQEARFREMATALLEERITELNKFKDSHFLTGKLARIKAFNSELEVLKRNLNDQIRSILDENKGSSFYSKLEGALKHIYEEFISEYMCLSFVKDGV